MSTAPRAREALGRFRLVIRRLTRQESELNSPDKTAAAAAEAARILAGGASREPGKRDLLALESRVRRALRHRKLDLLSHGDWRSVPWVLWQSDSPLAAIPELREVLERRLATRGGALRTLIRVYLRDHEPARPGMKEVGELIQRRLARASGALSAPWKARHEHWRLFDANEGASCIARAVLDSAQPAELVVQQIGLGDDLADCGLALSAYASALQIVRGSDSANASSSLGRRVLALLHWSARGDSLRYPELRVDLIEALLLPWATDPTQVDSETRSATLAALVLWFGDPRTNLAGWQGVDPGALEVVRRWLTGATLDTFFEVLDALADQREDGERLWQTRRRFWRAYFDNDYIDDAWLAFGAVARQRADLVMGRGFDAGGLSGTEATRSVILMRIRNVVVVESSPMGRCLLWTESHKDCPPLHARTYLWDALRVRSQEHFTHHGGDRGHWQQRAADFIWREAGVRVQPAEYLE